MVKGALLAHVRPALVLATLGAATIPLLFPYVFATFPDVEAKSASSGVPLWLAVASGTLQTWVLLALMSWAGLAAGARLGLDAPWIRAAADARERPVRQRGAWLLAIGLGFASGALILALDIALKPHFPPAMHPVPSAIARWKGFLASFYGGIFEEIVVRLFLMTLLTWIAARLLRATRPSAYWCAIVLAALLFALLHLPAALHIWPAAPIVIVHGLLLNGIGGLAFGWLFWKRGLEHAMVAHFVADLVLHVVGGA